MAKKSCAECGASFIGDRRRRYCDQHRPPVRPRKSRSSGHLRAVGAEERPQSRKPKTIAEAAALGSTLDELRMMRMRIARALDDPNCPPRDLAALSRRQIELGKEIDAALAREREEAEVGKPAEDEEWDEEAI